MRRFLRRSIAVALLVPLLWQPAADAADADPQTILKQAAAAMRDVKAVRYHTTVGAEGPMARAFPPITGVATIAKPTEGDLPRLRLAAQVKTTSPGRTRVSQLDVAHDGDQVVITDHGAKIVMRREMPAGENLLTRFLLVTVHEFGVPKPLQQELTSNAATYVGEETINDTLCDAVEVALGGDRGTVRWHFAKDDRLPRRVRRTLPHPRGDSHLTISVDKLDTDPQLAKDTFEPRMPEGFAHVGADGLLAVGSPAPDWTLKNGKGEEVSLKKLRGNVVVLDFWATWCRPCVMAMPKLQKLYKHYEDKPVKVFGVNCRERQVSAAQAVKFARQKNVEYPILVEGDEVASAYRVRGIPTFYVIDPAGKVAMAFAGLPQSEKPIIDTIDKLLAQADKDAGGTSKSAKAPAPSAGG